MSSAELLGRSSLSLTVALLLVSGALHSHPKLGAYCRWLLLTAALIGSAGLGFQITANLGSIYGRWDRATTAVGISLVWALVLWPSRSKRPAVAASILAALLLIGCWLPATPGWPRAIQGGWFWLAQTTTALGVSVWLYSACLALEPDQAPLKPILNWALLLQVAGVLGLAIGAQRAWGRALSWDPVECWWLFAVAMSALALWGWRQRNWRNPLVVLLGLVPALLGWFGSWFIIQALHLASLYMAGS